MGVRLIAQQHCRVLGVGIRPAPVRVNGGGVIRGRRGRDRTHGGLLLLQHGCARVGRVGVVTAGREGGVKLPGPAHGGRVHAGVSGWGGGGWRRGGAAVTHKHGVGPGDDGTLTALLVMLTQQHVADVVGRGGGVGRGDQPPAPVISQLIHMRHGLLHLLLGGRGQLGGAWGEGVHLMHAIHMEKWRALLHRSPAPVSSCHTPMSSRHTPVPPDVVLVVTKPGSVGGGTEVWLVGGVEDVREGGERPTSNATPTQRGGQGLHVQHSNNYFRTTLPSTLTASIIITAYPQNYPTF